ncbi:MAG: M36 family metallopeptidase [Planctomycetales bacterium]|nr:M36 family metallopeptidase [Planctomycetales bacterium]
MSFGYETNKYSPPSRVKLSHQRNRFRDQFLRKLRIENLEDRRLLAGDLVANLGNGQTQLIDVDGLPVYEAFAPTRTNLISYEGLLSAPSSKPALEIARDFLRSHVTDLGLTSADLSNSIVTDLYQTEHTGVTHIYFQQQFKGLPILNAHININVMPTGEVLNVGSTFMQLPEYSSTGNSPYTPFDMEPQPNISAIEALKQLIVDFGWPDANVEMVATEAGPANRSHLTLLASTGVAFDGVSAQLQYAATAVGPELVWRLNFLTPDSAHWYDAYLNATDGGLIMIDDWSSNATYNVYATPKESPTDGPRTLETDPNSLIASPFGWHDTNGALGAESSLTSGNNVTAYTDRDGDNLPDVGSSPDGGGGLTFNFPVDLAQQPNTYAAASVTNLFYWTNWLHDVHYAYGFNEAAGNFQVNNYGNGGAAGDSLLAESQDQADGGPNGPQRNNANMLVPPDGTSPRLQMYLFDQVSPLRDSSFDNGIVIHEYAHGVSSRLTGGPANAGSLGDPFIQSMGLAEGWSDFYSLMLTQVAADTANQSRTLGTYALGQPATGAGIRSLPFSYNMTIDTHTMSDVFDLYDPYIIGEVWASTLWDLNWALISGNGLDASLPNVGIGFSNNFLSGIGGNNLALQLVMDAMKLQPTTPTLLEARDAILLADLALTGGANLETLWRVFARRGMGYSASDGGSSLSTSEVVAAFDMPSSHDGTLQLNQASYVLGDAVLMQLRDLDLTTTASLTITSSSGDTESIAFDTPNQALYTGVLFAAVDTGAGPVAAGDGTLQVTAGDTITLNYLDADDGLGGTNVAKSVTATVSAHLASPLVPSLPLGANLGQSTDLVVLRSAQDVESFEFYAEAGELISLVVEPIETVTLQVQIVGESPLTSAASAGLPASLNNIAIASTGQHEIRVHTDALTLANLTIYRNSTSEDSVTDTTSAAPLSLDNSRLAVGTDGARYAVVGTSVPVGPGILNGGFETGDFSNWDVIAIGNPLAPWTVSTGGNGVGNGLIATSPPSGNFNAWNGFDGAGPMYFEMYQNILLPLTPVTLTWKDRIQWDFTSAAGVATESRTLDVNLLSSDGETLLDTIYSFDTGREWENPVGDTGWQTHFIPLKAWTGQFLRLSFLEFIPQIFTGYGQIEFDDIQLVGMPTPAPDVDEYTIDLTGRVGKSLDVILSSNEAALAGQTLELLAPNGTVVATGSSTPVNGVTSKQVTNYRQGILNYIVPSDGIYRVRLTSNVFGEYALVVTDNTAFDSEPNDQPATLLPLIQLDSKSGAVGYVDGVAPYTKDSVQYEWEEISATGTRLFLADDQISNALPLGFTHTYYGQNYTNAYVGSNGFMTFLANQSIGPAFGPTMPGTASPNAVLAGWWRDLNPQAGGSIYYQTLGPAGDRRFIVQFNDVPHFSDLSLGVSMEFKIFESTGDMEVHYKKAPADGRPHTAGIENETGTVGLQHYNGFDSLPEQSAVRYAPTSKLDRYQIHLDAGREITLVTTTPFDAAGHAVPSNLDPELTILDPNGNPVASDLNGAGDGKNARLVYTAPVTGNYSIIITATTGQGEYSLEYLLTPIPVVESTAIFYNGSSFDSGGNDDLAMATDKSAYRAGSGVATYANYTNYTRGINGIMVDISSAPGNLSTNDFVFRVGNNQTPATWANAPVPNSFQVRPGAGVNGSDRVVITWADNAIQNQWLQVTVLANANTGLTLPDVMYWGNQIAEVGDTVGSTAVDVSDTVLVALNPTGFIPANISNPYDLNRDKAVDAADYILSQLHQTGFFTLVLLNLGSNRSGSGDGNSSSLAELVVPVLAVMPNNWLELPLLENASANLLNSQSGRIESPTDSMALSSSTIFDTQTIEAIAKTKTMSTRRSNSTESRIASDLALADLASELDWLSASAP